MAEAGLEPNRIPDQLSNHYNTQSRFPSLSITQIPKHSSYVFKCYIAVDTDPKEIFQGTLDGVKTVCHLPKPNAILHCALEL